MRPQAACQRWPQSLRVRPVSKKDGLRLLGFPADSRASNICTKALGLGSCFLSWQGLMLQGEPNCRLIQGFALCVLILWHLTGKLALLTFVAPKANWFRLSLPLATKRGAPNL